MNPDVSENELVITIYKILNLVPSIPKPYARIDFTFGSYKNNPFQISTPVGDGPDAGFVCLIISSILFIFFYN